MNDGRSQKRMVLVTGAGGFLGGHVVPELLKRVAGIPSSWSQAGSQAGRSHLAATNHGSGSAPFSETDWTDVESKRVTPYYKSKTMAERAAWAFLQERGLPLAVINPGFILGPLIGNEFGSSVGLIWKLITASSRDFRVTPAQL